MKAYTGTLLTAVALMLVIEGLLPFLLPMVWRDAFRRLTEMSDGQIRFVGLSSMLAGLLLLFLTKYPNIDFLDRSDAHGPVRRAERPCRNGCFLNTSRISCPARRREW